MGRTRYARTGGVRIGYELRGRLHRRRPWLVLIQGMGLDRHGWERVAGKLRRRFRLVLVDNRGCGRSDRPARIPRAKLRIFPELGHLFFWEEPDAFAAAVTSFLAERPELTPGRGRRSRAGRGPRAGRWR